MKVSRPLHVDLFQGFQVVGNERRAGHDDAALAFRRQLRQPLVRVGGQPGQPSEARLKAHAVALRLDAELARQQRRRLQRLMPITGFVRLGIDAAAIGIAQAMVAGGIRALQVPLRQSVIAQQQMIEGRLEVRPHAGGEHAYVVRVAVEGRQYGQAHAAGQQRTHLLDAGRVRGVGVLRIQRHQQQIVDAGSVEACQRLTDARFAVAHCQNDRVFAFGCNGALQALGLMQQRRTVFVRPDGGIGFGAVFRPRRQNEQVHDEPADGRGNIDDVGIREKLLQVRAYVTHRRARGSAQIQQQNASSHYRSL